jgi:indolepyruvate ferredoxin oxidoreductase beta subunit
MKTDIILGGVGGQGILSIAAVIGSAALYKNLNIKQSEVHGMSQRGGAVYSHLRISDQAIASDLIPLGGADLIIAVEPMESLRYLSYLKPDGWLITNSKSFINITDYPEESKIFEEIRRYKNHILIDAEDIAKKIKTSRSSNIVMVGAAAPFLNLTAEELENGIRRIFESKGEEIVSMNIESFRKGMEFSLSKK